MDSTLLIEIIGSLAIGALVAFLVIRVFRVISAFYGVLAEMWADRQRRSLRR
jgi:hypothetical protein